MNNPETDWFDSIKLFEIDGTGITQRQCSPTLTPLIFGGGWDNGYSQIGIKQSMCSPGVFRNVFRGESENSMVKATLFAGCAPIADFEAGSPVVCVGDTVSFTDLSMHNPTSWYGPSRALFVH